MLQQSQQTNFLGFVGALKNKWRIKDTRKQYLLI